jgi:succinate dehydrogenase / fumarate reductase, membrane anchor subunit
MSIQTPLGRVRGYGSAKSGTQHFWYQRMTAVALVPLTLWFVWAVVRYTGAPHAEVMLFLSHPVSGIAMAMFVVVGLVHMLLGAKVVIEDYIHRESTKIALLVLLHFAVFAVGATCVVAVLRILT